MKEKITQICKRIEEENGVKILFAVENGSRAWRMSSNDSDYDVRFVFAHPIEEYIKIIKPEDVIQLAFDEGGNRVEVEGSLIDLSGFDVIKYVKMLTDSNPTTIEWLMSDIVYFGEQNKVFKKFAVENFSAISLYHHYKSLCKNNYLKYLKSKNNVTYKRYLYSFRGLINAKWVAHKKSLPPISFPEAIEKSKGLIDESILNRLSKIILLKKEGKEKDIIENIKEMDEYIEIFLKDDSEISREKQVVDIKKLEMELQKIILRK